MEKLKKQYQIEILDYATDDLLDCEIEFTEKEAIQTAEKGASNDTYCLISELEQDYTHSTFEIIPFSLTAIQNITTHEFGHALGLGHYKVTDYPIYTADQPWINASIMYYAINPAHDDIAKPKYVDLKMVEKIYGEDGFGGAKTPPIKTGYYTAGDDDICTHKCGIDRFDKSINRFIFGQK